MPIIAARVLHVHVVVGMVVDRLIVMTVVPVERCIVVIIIVPPFWCYFCSTNIIIRYNEDIIR